MEGLMATKNPRINPSRPAQLSKSRVMAHLQCPKRLWLQTYQPELAEEDDRAQAQMSAGNKVGEVARELYPGGVLIDGENLSKACLDTERALADPSRPVFEATLKHDGVLVRADLLLPEKKAWRLVEVKSSTSVKEYHYADAAIQTWVIKGAGVRVDRTELAHIDSSFVYPGGGDYRGLLKHVNVTEEVRDLQRKIPEWVETARLTLAGDEPTIEPGEQCETPYTCPFFAHCNKEDVGEEQRYPVELLHRNRRLAASLREQGYDDLREVPQSALNNAVHQRMWRVAQSGRPELDPGAKDALKDLPYPRYYLDFETLQFALPIWAGTRPYAQIPMQWSCHVEKRPGELEHHAFLAESTEDPQRAFAETLVSVLGEEGPIFVYNIAFERTRIRELADRFSDLSGAFDAVNSRLVDLYPITVANYYHPAMNGSWSLKAVLPTIAPELSHEDLTISNGDMAQEGLRAQLDPELPAAERLEIRQALLEYCKRDTLALVELARFIQGHET